MHPKVWLGVLGCAIALSACDDGGSGDEDSTTGATSSSTDDVQTTIPVTSVSDATTDPTTAGSTSTTTGGDTDTDTDTDTDAGTDTDGTSSSGTTEGTSGSSSSSGGEDTTTTGEPTVWDVGWCNLQFPATIAAGTADTTTAYSRVYAEGLTDQTPGNDIDDNLVVEFGYGADGSDPAEAEWTWISAEGNVGWNGNDAGQPNNDEYQGDLQFAEAGTFDYAARVSGDGGTTWVYCDLDGLVEGGYTPDQAGDAVIE